ncbi:RDD family protein [Bdellovibrionota bacterium FG-1]
MPLDMTSYAPLGRRFLALLLDLMILFIPCALAGHIIPVIGSLVVLFFYAPILESSELRATLGKHLVGIQVTDPMGRRISLRAATIRNVLKFVSSMLLFIGFFFALFNPKKQTLHDLLADTLVVYGRSERPIADAWMAQIRELFQSSPAPTEPTETPSVLSQLERLQALRDKAALTEDEFQEQKRALLKTVR